ncbi:MAG: FecR family protein [Bacteroidales bacterium]
MAIEWNKINRLISGVANDQEKAEIAEWASKSHSRQKFLKDAVKFYSSEDDLNVTFDDVNNAWRNTNPIIRTRKRYLKRALPVAAASLLLIFSILLFTNRTGRQELPLIEPGTERAKLFLADGRDINLGKDTKELSAKLPVKQKVENKKTTLTIDVKNRASAQLLEYNEIIVPRYAEYQLNLEDGTKVWLNSETKLKFPLVFGEKERTVYIEGEAYFQVAHNPAKPFIVHIDENTKVKVLGTEFNVRTYESTISQSTLISGSIEFIHNGYITKVSPGESCSLDKTNGTVSVVNADIMQVIAWKNGEFVFRNETLENIINELSRWYKVDVSFENDQVKNERFYLYFDRSAGFEEIIYKLHKTGKIKYEYKNKKIIIS